MPHKTSGYIFILAALLVATAPLAAQAQEQRVHFTFGGGATIPNSEVRDRLGDGYNFNFGIEVAVNPVVSIEGLYSFNGLGDKRISLPVSVNPVDGDAGVPTDFFADMNMQRDQCPAGDRMARVGVARRPQLRIHFAADGTRDGRLKRRK